MDAIPGVGPALVTALVASIADAKAFRSGRDLSAWVELVPKQNSSAGNVVPRFVRDGCAVRNSARDLGYDNARILGEWLGMSASEQERLRSLKVI